jgi:hypothetical protein
VDGEGASCPCNWRIKYFIKTVLAYGAVEGSSCPQNRRLKYFYRCYLRIYGCRRGLHAPVLRGLNIFTDVILERRGFMPSNRRIKYLTDIILDYMDIEVASCPSSMRIK